MKRLLLGTLVLFSLTATAPAALAQPGDRGYVNGGVDVFLGAATP